MEHRLEQRDGVTVLHVTGDIDVSHTLVLRDALGGALDVDAPRVVLDLSGVGFVDSAGIGLFVTAHRRAEQQGGRFVLAGAGEAVGHVLALTRTDRLLTVLPTVDEAVATVAAQP